jgi:hypothetical protein
MDRELRKAGTGTAKAQIAAILASAPNRGERRLSHCCDAKIPVNLKPYSAMMMPPRHSGRNATGTSLHGKKTVKPLEF